MPLHLLGKKSWNVYNADNVARVRRDEALAEAREAEEEQRMQEVDAERRLAILRGQAPPPPPSARIEDDTGPKREKRSRESGGRETKRRKLAGEDDTDRDIRIALQRNKMHAKASREGPKDQERKRTSDALLTDRDGHINLFPIDPRVTRKADKNAEAEAEAAKKKKEYEDQYTMRFSNAAGFKQAVDKKPWYASNSNVTRENTNGARAEGAGDWDTVGKDAWGNEDPRRRDRERTRLDTSDPMAAMRRAQGQLKNVERDRRRWKEEREREERELRELREQRETQQRKRRDKERNKERERSERGGRPSKKWVDEDEIESFNLDAAPQEERLAYSGRDRFSRPRRHSHRSRSPNGYRPLDRISYGSRERSRSRSRGRDRSDDRPWSKRTYEYGTGRKQAVERSIAA